jgi:soluble lytic murein transglycosylase-like protein
MRSAFLTLFALACLAVFAGSACGQDQSPYPQPPTGFDPIVSASTPSPDAAPLADPAELGGPSLELMITKSMLYAAGMKHGVNPFLVMGLAWHESGWQSSVVSSAGAVGIMQVMPATAAVDGPELLGRSVNLYDPGDNIDIGTAILKHNLDHWHNDLAKALCAYYAGGAAVSDWATMRADCKRYVWAVYNAAMMFKQGRGPA